MCKAILKRLTTEKTCERCNAELVIVQSSELSSKNIYQCAGCGYGFTHNWKSKSDEVSKSKLLIMPIASTSFYEYGSYEYREGVFYINGNSYPESIVQVAE